MLKIIRKLSLILLSIFSGSQISCEGECWMACDHYYEARYAFVTMDGDYLIDYESFKIEDLELRDENGNEYYTYSADFGFEHIILISELDNNVSTYYFSFKDSIKSTLIAQFHPDTTKCCGVSYLVDSIYTDELYHFRDTAMFDTGATIIVLND